MMVSVPRAANYGNICGNGNRSAMGTGGTRSPGAPSITGITLERTKSAGGTSYINAQLDVGTTYTYYLNFTLEDTEGWCDIGADGYVHFNAWYDLGSESTTYEDADDHGVNYAFRMKYVDTGYDSAPSDTECSVDFGEVTLEGANITTVIANQKYTFGFNFTLHKYIKQADALSGTGISYDDLNSWNFNITAYDGNEAHTIADDDGTTGLEFGVLKYTEVSVGNDWAAGSIAPGSSGTANKQTITYYSNDDFVLKIELDSTLYCAIPSETIAVTNIEVTAAGDSNDDITSDTAFTAENTPIEILSLTSGNIHGDHSVYNGNTTQASPATIDIEFKVTVPFGTLAGDFTADIIVTIDQV